MKLHFNRLQPVRESDGLNYTRYPRYVGKKPVRYADAPTMIIQCRLYRAIHQDIIPLRVGIGDLHESLFSDVSHISTKKKMGQIIIQATIYEPRKILALGNNKTVAIYSWADIRDLKYGLEWMICIWLWRLQNEGYEKTDPEYISTSEQMEEELRLLAEMRSSEYADFEEAMYGTEYPEPDWENIIPGLEPHEVKRLIDPNREDPLMKWRRH